MNASLSGDEVFGKPALYRIRVRGRLDGWWKDYMGDLEIVIHEGGPGQPTTTELKGLVEDQAALMGMLGHLNARGVAILDVERREAD